jgi:hypothetical protein
MQFDRSVGFVKEWPFRAASSARRWGLQRLRVLQSRFAGWSRIPRQVSTKAGSARYASSAFSSLFCGFSGPAGASNPMRRLVAGKGSMSSRMASTSP